MRPEWARTVGEKTIDKMNHAASTVGTPRGGVVWPLPGGTWRTYPGHDGIDLNAPNDDGKPYYAAAPRQDHLHRHRTRLRRRGLRDRPVRHHRLRSRLQGRGTCRS